MIRLPILFSLCLALAAPLAGAAPASGLAGHYYLEDGPTEVGSELLLKASGQFEWALMYGAEDYQAQGTWKLTGTRLDLSVAPPLAPVFRNFTEDDYRGTKPAEPGRWIALVGVPHVAPVPGIEVRFEARSGKTADAVSEANGDAIVEMPAGEVWTRAGLRSAGKGDWQWLPVPPERAQARLAGFALTNVDAVQRAPFKSLTLRVEKDGLVVDDDDTMILRGRYSKH